MQNKLTNNHVSPVLPSLLRRVQVSILVIGLAVSCTCFAGCDLGTYNKRLNDRTAPPAEPANSDEPAEDDSQTAESGS